MIQGQLPYTVEQFKNQTLMYYENNGLVRLTGANWQLITYLPLESYDSRHDKLYKELAIMTNQCKNNQTTYEICSKFDNIFKIMFQEISVQREKMYESIGKYQTESMGESTTGMNRKKRGLINFVGSAMKTLFGVCDEDCANESIEKVYL